MISLVAWQHVGNDFIDTYMVSNRLSYALIIASNHDGAEATFFKCGNGRS